MCGSATSYWYTTFFFNDTATTEIYTLSLHDALPIYAQRGDHERVDQPRRLGDRGDVAVAGGAQRDGRVVDRVAEVHLVGGRSEEHTSELQSRQYLVCRLLLEKKKINQTRSSTSTHNR